MLDSVRSFINTGLNTFLAAQSQQNPEVSRVEALSRLEKAKTDIEKPVVSPAYEISLSPQAVQLLKALEERKLSQTDSSNQENGTTNNNNAQPRPAIQRPAVSVALDRLLSQYGTPEFDQKNTEKLDKLFEQVEKELQAIGIQANQNTAPVTEYKSSLARLRAEQQETTNSPITQVNQPLPIGSAIEGPDGFTATERVKTAILYAELDKILGQSGVFFGGDQLIGNLDKDLQGRAGEAKENLSQLLKLDRIPSGQLTPGQEARLDALYREITQIQRQAIDRNADQRNLALNTLIGVGPATPRLV